MEMRKGKPTKAPYQLSGYPAESDNKSTWTGFDKVKHVEPTKDGGIGFVFDGSGVVGIDLDSAILPDGTIDPMFKSIVDSLQSYCEVSPSGIGLHIFIRCNEPPYDTGRRKKYENGKGIEIYSKTRYFTITGNRWGNSPNKIHNYDAAFVRTLCDPLLNPPKIVISEEPVRSEEIHRDLMNDDEIVGLAEVAKNSEKVIRLMSGDTAGYASESEADSAFAAIIAYYTKDANQISRIMRRSGLRREKWDSNPGYLHATIAGALSLVKTQYKPSQSRSVGKKKASREKLPYLPEESQTQSYFAGLFVDEIRHEWRFNIDAGKWLHWNGKFWELDDKNSIHNVCRTFLIRQLHNISEGDPDEQIEDEVRALVRMNSARGISDIITLSKPMLSLKERELDTQKLFLNTLNGTYDLETGILHHHDPELLISKCCGVEYNRDAVCPTWESHIETTLDGDLELISNVQELLGYSLFAGNPAAIFGVLVGSGRNGKSVTVETVESILGSYAVSINPNALMDSGCNPGSDRMKMIGARLIVAAEPGDTSKGRCSLDAGFIKACTGGDTISSRRLYCESVTFKVEGLCLIITNTLPQIRDQSVAMRERVWCVPFDHYFAPEDRKTDIKDILFAEGSGILNWLIAGYQRYAKDKLLKQCGTISKQTTGYLDDEDTYSPFMSESGIIRKPGLSIQASVLYDRYVTWHNSKGFQSPARSPTSFGRHMSTRFQKKRTESGLIYLGIGIVGQNGL